MEARAISDRNAHECYHQSCHIKLASVYDPHSDREQSARSEEGDTFSDWDHDTDRCTISADDCCQDEVADHADCAGDPVIH